MQKKDFLIPGIVIVLALGIGIWLVAHSINPIAAILPSDTATTTLSEQVSTTTPVAVIPPKAAYYPYGALTLSLNQVAGFKDGLSIRPTSVLEDSRCPADVQCVQAGTVRITLKTNTGTVSVPNDLALGKTITVGGDDITFISVRPERMKETGAPSDSAYRFTLRVDPHVATPKEGTTGMDAPCYIGGCSAELCTDSSGGVSSCIYRPEYGCYKGATCERQTTGKCGWTQTKELQACLKDPSSLKQ